MKRANSMHTLTHHFRTESVTFPSEIKKIAKKVYLTLVRLSKNHRYIKRIAIFGIAIGGFILAYIPLVIKRRNIIKTTRLASKDLAFADQRSLMVLHLDIEETIKDLEMMLQGIDTSRMFNPIKGELQKIILALKMFERSLFNHLYPDYDKPLTKEQDLQLIETFRPWREEEYDEKHAIS